MDHNFFPWCHPALMHSEYFQLTLAGPAKTTVTLLGQYQPLSGSDREWPFITSVLNQKYIQIQIQSSELPEGYCHCTLPVWRALFMLSRYHYQFDRDSQVRFMREEIYPSYLLQQDIIVKIKSNIHFRRIVVVSCI